VFTKLLEIAMTFVFRENRKRETDGRDGQTDGVQGLMRAPREGPI